MPTCQSDLNEYSFPVERCHQGQPEEHITNRIGQRPVEISCPRDEQALVDPDGQGNLSPSRGDLNQRKQFEHEDRTDIGGYGGCPEDDKWAGPPLPSPSVNK